MESWVDVTRMATPWLPAAIPKVWRDATCRHGFIEQSSVCMHGGLAPDMRCLPAVQHTYMAASGSFNFQIVAMDHPSLPTAGFAINLESGAHLVAGAQLLQGLGAHAVHGLTDVGRLLLNVHQHLRWRGRERCRGS